MFIVLIDYDIQYFRKTSCTHSLSVQLITFGRDCLVANEVLSQVGLTTVITCKRSIE